MGVFFGDKESKRLKDKERKRQREEETKSRRVKETKSQREEETKRQRVCAEFVSFVRFVFKNTFMNNS